VNLDVSRLTMMLEMRQVPTVSLCRWSTRVVIAIVALTVVVVASAGPHLRPNHMVRQNAGEPTLDDALEVVRLLPGEPHDWLYPGAVPRSISFQRPTMVDPTPTRILALDTQASADDVRVFYDTAVVRARVQRLNSPERIGRIVLKFRGGSVLIGRRGDRTLIVIVAEEHPLAAAPAN
jgi:hypothetical protein